MARGQMPLQNFFPGTPSMTMTGRPAAISGETVLAADFRELQTIGAAMHRRSAVGGTIRQRPADGFSMAHQVAGIDGGTDTGDR